MLNRLVRMLVLVVLVLNSRTGRANPEASWAPGWTASLYKLEPDALLSGNQLTDATGRQSVRLSQTGRLRSLSNSWIVHGDQLDPTTLSSAVSIEHWYQLAAVQVEDPNARVIVAGGDSITDGSRSTLVARLRRY